ncbi:MAG: NAD(P)H-hydrate dehydratase [Clostridia bacterium]|nr:NAD(P)H-hydrate dehydratase [Clostridia bacterium]
MGCSKRMIGADVVDIRRIKSALELGRFKMRVFTKNEQAYAEKQCNPYQSYAAMYAAKEAVAKLGGKGIRGFALTDIEVVHNDMGAPEVVLHGNAQKLFDGKVYVSLSHERDYAFAVASYAFSEIKPIMPGVTVTDGDLELLPRLRFTHKGDYGRVFVIGGNGFMVGAPLITAEAAVRAGAGLTTLCVAQSMLDAYRPRVKEIMLKGLPDESGMICFNEEALSEIATKADVIVIGMGMGANPSLPAILEWIFTNYNGMLVCDADGINALVGSQALCEQSKRCTLVLTPHVGEYQRIQKALGTDSVSESASKIGAVIACKSAYTIISDGITDYNVTSGCAAMAKGGSGDALAGIIGAYLCRTTPLQATALACHHFGRCGEKAAAIKGENAVTASDIIACL